MENFKKITYDIDEDVIEDLLVDKVKSTLDCKVNSYRDRLLYTLYNCESPIEQLMALELDDVEYYFIASDTIEIIGNSCQVDIKCDDKKYRVDFLMEIVFKYNGKYKNILKLIIECDGHDFHEKTKEQVIKDNKRDRDLKNEGYEILHFSGSEIYNNTFNISKDIKKFIIKKYLSYVKNSIER